MSALLRGNVRMALASIRSTKWRSAFTMLGVVFAVVPVLLILGIGEGVKRQITDQVHDLGSDMLTVRPGELKQDSDVVGQFNALSGYSSASAFTMKNYTAVEQMGGIDMISPVSIVPGAIKTNRHTTNDVFVAGVTEDFPDLINRSVQHGEFFTDNDSNRRVAVLGRGAAEEIFGEGIPLGRGFEFHGQNFVVRGVLERYTNPPLSFAADFNNAVIIPHQVATALSGSTAINEILVRPTEGIKVEDAERTVGAALQESRGGSRDFSVLTQAENYQIANRILSLVTGFVSGVAAIALLVSGIGVMNVMLVSVTERMHEIGIRKAIGATKRQILGQFMAEAVVLSALGGIVGIILTFVVQFFVRVFTNIEPVITLPSVLIVFGLAIIIGVVFGTFPAVKAAQKDPIEALRQQ